MHSLTRIWTPILLTLLPTLALAATKPAVVYSVADKYDHSVNQQVYEEGVVRYRKETGIQVTERAPAGAAERLNTLRQLAGDGYIPTYTRTDFTDDLHDAFGFRTDYQIITKKQMKKILKMTTT